MSTRIGCGHALRTIRERAGLSQEELAREINVDSNKIARIESGGIEPNPQEATRWVARCGGPEAERLSACLNTPWPPEIQPEWDHPDLESLALAARTLRRIDESLPGVGDILREPLRLYRLGLLQQADFLSRRDHPIAMVGPVGVGKTTIEALAIGLVAPKPGAAPTHRDVVLMAGAGRTTVCEVRIVEGERWSIRVEPETEANLRLYVDALCAAMMGASELPPEEDPGLRESVPMEIARALKNMASFTDGPPDGAPPDMSLEQLKAEFWRRLRLPERQTTELRWSEAANPSPLLWLKTTLRSVNNGNSAGVPLPARMWITVPRPLMDGDYRLTLIDTRGVDQSVVRPDLAACLDDPRTATVLCSTFGGAPDLYTTQLLRFAADTGITGLADRVAILVHAKGDEALDVRREADGEAVDDAAEGYSVKAGQVALAMRNVEPAGIDVVFFNAATDPVQHLRNFFKARVNATREPARRRIRELMAATAEILDNPNAAAVRAAQVHAGGWLRTALDQEEAPGEVQEAPWQRLVDQIGRAHPRTVWAMLQRSGDWANLDVPFFIGAGGAADAQRRSLRAAERLSAVLRTLRARPDLAPASRMCDEVEGAISDARAQFVAEVRGAATATYGPAIKADAALWSHCRAFWGKGKGFRDKVALEVTRWFTSAKRAELHAAYANACAESWRAKLIQPLQRRASSGT